MRKYFLGMSFSRKGAATATNRRFNKKSNKMNAFKRNAGKVLLGVSIAAGAAYATAGSVQEARAHEKSLDEVTYGVLNHVGNRYYITADPISPESGSCGLESYPCKITFEDGDVAIMGDATNGWYVLDNADFDTTGNGPYSN